MHSDKIKLRRFALHLYFSGDAKRYAWLKYKTMRRDFNMKLQKPAIFFFIIMASCLFFANDSLAVAFKLMNDTSYTVRARAHDRGEWREWKEFYPSGWGDFAKKVKRTKHKVEIDIKKGNKWYPLYRGKHGSKLWTRVAQLVVSGNKIGIQWYNERGGGCRDKPPLPGHRDDSCLKKSGDWLAMEIIKIGTTLISTTK